MQISTAFHESHNYVENYYVMLTVLCFLQGIFKNLLRTSTAVLSAILSFKVNIWFGVELLNKLCTSVVFKKPNF